MQTAQEIDERNAQRDERVIEAATSIIGAHGLSGLTREALANEARLSPASVSNFGRTRITNGDHDSEGYRPRLLRALMNRAITTGDIRMLRIGLADGCLKDADVPTRLRSAAGL